MLSIDQVKHFLFEETPSFLNSLKADTSPIFGVMNSTQVVEHMEISLRLPISDVEVVPIHSPERTELARQFLYTDKPIRPGAQKPELYRQFETPEMDLKLAIGRFQDTLTTFKMAAESGKLKGIHPVFGELNNEEWLRFEEKHLRHHLVQFGFEG